MDDSNLRPRIFEACDDINAFYNSRVRAPMIRFLMNFLGKDEIKKRFDVDDGMFNLMVTGYQNYYFLELDAKNEILKIVDCWSFKVDRRISLKRCTSCGNKMDINGEEHFCTCSTCNNAK